MHSLDGCHHAPLVSSYIAAALLTLFCIFLRGVMDGLAYNTQGLQQSTCTQATCLALHPICLFTAVLHACFGIQEQHGWAAMIMTKQLGGHHPMLPGLFVYTGWH